MIFVRMGTGGKAPEKIHEKANSVFLEMAVAYRYVGPWDLLLHEATPAETILAKDRMAELRRRATIMGEGTIKDQDDPDKAGLDANVFLHDPGEFQWLTLSLRMNSSPIGVLA
jgi:hypothetical protein